MSHFTVLVVGDDIDEQLIPFEESPENGSPYLVFADREDEVKLKYETEKATRKVGADGKSYWPWEKEVKDSTEDVKISFRQLYHTFEAFAEEYYGYEKNSETERYGYWHNPDAKWDWYAIGGRWSNFFKLKDGTYADSAKKKDIDFEVMKEEAYQKRLEEWDSMIGKYDEKMRETLYGIKPTDAKESYAAKGKSVTTFAVLKDGKWYERGSMGFWAIVSNEKIGWEDEFNKLLESIPDDETITLVDCHI